MKVSSMVEQIFANAVALEQSGGLRNTIYATGSRVYIMNYDHTFLMQFKLRKSEAPFEHEVSFRANDYDSNEFSEKDGKIIFTSRNGDYTRTKKCATPDLNPSDVKKLFHKLNGVDKDDFVFITMDSGVLTLLDRSLSHTEFIGKAGAPLTLVQRNIYDGTLIEITKDSKDKASLLQDNSILEFDIEPIAIKTSDLAALFTFQDVLQFGFPKAGTGNFIIVNSIQKQKRDMTVIIACCVYDEVIAIQEASHKGMEEDVEEILPQKVMRRKK